MVLEHDHILAGSKRILLLPQKVLKIIFIYKCVCVCVFAIGFSTGLAAFYAVKQSSDS